MDAVTLAAAQASGVKRYVPALRRQFASIASRAQAAGINSPAALSNGTDLSTTYQLQHTILATANGLRLRYSNVYDNGGVETDGPNAITVAASFWTNISGIGDERFPVTFSGGAASVTIQPGCHVESDLIGVDVVKGQLVYTRTFVSVASAGMKWPLSLNTRAGFNREGGVAGSDLTGSGTSTAAFTQNGVQAYGPSTILGHMTKSPFASVIAIMGDSLAAGNGDGSAGSANVDQGYIVRALNSNYAYQRVAMNSDGPSHWFTQSTCRRLAALLEGCTHMIWEHGVNYRATNLQLYSATCWLRYAARGFTIYAATITPQSNSTDSWATTTNQTIASPATEGFRTGYNDWIRGGAPLDPGTLAPVAVGTTGALVTGKAGHPLAGYFEVADLAESARNSGIWKAGYTADGTHPNATGAAALAAGVTLSVFIAAA